VKRHFELHNELQDHYEDEYNEINHESLYCSRIIKELSFQKIYDRRERDQSFLSRARETGISPYGLWQ
jgi:hypothetical protein